MDHFEIFAISQLYQNAKGTFASDDFKEGFLAGVHYMEILHEERLCGKDKSEAKEKK